ncbi:hypothetical protein [Roseateles sp. L2-2]|uniref:hypothetical protein n=1 Tax=Roseateles sp. L2-2 TaxID=3422597 RepID=UPI003D366A01
MRSNSNRQPKLIDRLIWRAAGAAIAVLGLCGFHFAINAIQTGEVSKPSRYGESSFYWETDPLAFSLYVLVFLICGATCLILGVMTWRAQRR